MVNFVVLRHPVTNQVTMFTKLDNLTSHSQYFWLWHTLSAANALKSYSLGQLDLDYHGNGSRTVYFQRYIRNKYGGEKKERKVKERKQLRWKKNKKKKESLTTRFGG